MDAGACPTSRWAAVGRHFYRDGRLVEYRASARFGDTVIAAVNGHEARSRHVSFAYRATKRCIGANCWPPAARAAHLIEVTQSRIPDWVITRLNDGAGSGRGVFGVVYDHG